MKLSTYTVVLTVLWLACHFVEPAVILKREYFTYAQCRKLLPTERCFFEDCYGKGSRSIMVDSWHPPDTIADRDIPFPMPRGLAAINISPANRTDDSADYMPGYGRYIDYDVDYIWDEKCCRLTQPCYDVMLEDMRAAAPGKVTSKNNPDGYARMACCMRLMQSSCQDQNTRWRAPMPRKFVMPPKCMTGKDFRWD